MARLSNNFQTKHDFDGYCFIYKEEKPKLQRDWREPVITVGDMIQAFKRKLNFNVVRIRGVSENEDAEEDTPEVVLELFRAKLGLDLTTEDFLTCHRSVNIDNSLPRDIVARFHSGNVRSEILKRSLKKQDLTFSILDYLPEFRRDKNL